MAFGDSQVGLLFRIKSDSSQAADDIKTLTAQIERETVQASRSGSSALGSLGDSVTSLASSFSNLGAGLQNVGATLAASITAPIVALGSLGVKSALELDKVRNKITALLGDSEKANNKIIELRALADKSAGVLQSTALDSFAQLKGIGGIADQTINKLIGSVGKLNAAFDIPDAKEFNRNLVQIFSQDFERQDIKQALGTVPIFEQLLKQAFGTADSEKLQELKAQGKLTLDAFLGGLSDAVATDPRTANIGDSLSTQIARGFERINVALAPLGKVILDNILPAFDRLVPLIQELSEYFASLSPTVQSLVIAFGAVAAAIAPVVFVLGSLAIAVGGIIELGAALAGLITAAGGLTVVLPVIAAVGAALALLAAAGVALYAAWETNFGGIRDFTLQALDAVKSAVEAAMNAIVPIVRNAAEAIRGFWDDNFGTLQSITQKASDGIRSTIETVLSAVQSVWESHGARIVAYLETYWDTLKTITSGAMEIIGDYIRLALQVINGDWRGAWETFKETIKDAFRVVTEAFVGLNKTAVTFLAALVSIVAEYGVKANAEMLKAVIAIVATINSLPARLITSIPTFINAGKQIGEAIWQGIKDGLAGKEKQDPITIPNTPTTSDITGGDSIFVYDASTPAKAEQTAQELSEKQKKAAEKLEDDNKATQARINQVLAEGNRKAFESLQRELIESYKERGISQEEFNNQFLENEKAFRIKQLAFIDDQFAAERAKRENQTAKRKELLKIQEQQAKKDIIDTSFGREDEARDQIRDQNKKIEAEQKDAQKKQVKIAEQTEEQKLELQRAGYEKRIAELDAQQIREKRKESDYARDLAKIREDAIKDEIESNKRLLASLPTGDEKRAEVSQRIAVLQVELDTQKIRSANDVAAAVGKETEELNKQFERLLELQERIRDIDEQLRAIRSDATRGVLEKNIGTKVGKERIEAIRELRDFDIQEELRRQKAIEDNLARQEAADLKEVDGKKKTAAEIEAIEELYRKRKEESEAEHFERLRGIRSGSDTAIDAAGNPGGVAGFSQFLTEGLGEAVGLTGDALGALQPLADGITNAFGSMAQAVGDSVKAFVLFGSAGGGFKKFAAEMIASLAQMAAIQAVWEAAQGFAMLALAYFGVHPTAGLSATQHFIAAGVYGGIAGIAAVAGRAVAGDSFKQQSGTGAATGGTGSGATSGLGGGTSRTSNVSGANDDRITITENRVTAPQRVEHVVRLQVQSNDSHIINTVVNDHEKRGSIYNLINVAVEGT